MRLINTTFIHHLLHRVHIFVWSCETLVLDLDLVTYGPVRLSILTYFIFHFCTTAIVKELKPDDFLLYHKQCLNRHCHIKDFSTKHKNFLHNK